MKKELFAALLLAVILAVSLINIRAMNVLSDELSNAVEKATDEARKENWDQSAYLAETAIDRWLGKDTYTHIVMRHSDIESMTNDFYELLNAIYNKSVGETNAKAELVTAHLKSISAIEEIRLGSIF